MTHSEDRVEQQADRDDGQDARRDGSVAGGEDEASALLDQAWTEEVERLRDEVDRINDRHLRLAAEFDNYRKRVERERAEQHTRAQADLATRLLDILDDLQRVAQYADTGSPQALVDGVLLVERKLTQVLESSGLEAVDAEGRTFDPMTMEAVATVPAESADDDDVVADVFQQGYRFKGQLIRPARVRVQQYEA
jgi:molecular chaperone GrpE